MIIFGGLLFSVVLTYIIGLLCGGVVWLIDFPSLLIIVLPMIFFFCTTKSGGVIGGYIKSSFKKNHEYGAAELQVIALAAKNTVKVILAAGWLGFFAGLIAMLANMDTPTQIGPILAVSLVSLYYAIAISYFMFFPVQAWAENKAKQDSLNTNN